MTRQCHCTTIRRRVPTRNGRPQGGDRCRTQPEPSRLRNERHGCGEGCVMPLLRSLRRRRRRGLQRFRAYGATPGAHRLDCGGKRSATPLPATVQGAKPNAAWRCASRRSPKATAPGLARRANAARVEPQPFSLPMNRSAELEFGAPRSSSGLQSANRDAENPHPALSLWEPGKAGPGCQQNDRQPRGRMNSLLLLPAGGAG